MLITAVMLGIFVIMVAVALGYPPESRLLPLVIGIPGIVLSSVQLMHDLRGQRPSAKWEGQARQELVLFVYFVALVSSVLLFGFWLTIPVFLILFLRWHEGEKWRLVLPLTAGAWLAIFLLFDRLLGVVLHPGFVTEYFR